MHVDGRAMRTVWLKGNGRAVDIIGLTWPPHAFEIATVQITPEASSAANQAFDVTPVRLVTGPITESGMAEASRESIAVLLPGRIRQSA